MLQDPLVLVALDIDGFVFVIQSNDVVIMGIQGLMEPADVSVGDAGEDPLMLQKGAGGIPLELRVVGFEKPDPGVVRQLRPDQVPDLPVVGQAKSS